MPMAFFYRDRRVFVVAPALGHYSSSSDGPARCLDFGVCDIFAFGDHRFTFVCIPGGFAL